MTRKLVCAAMAWAWLAAAAAAAPAPDPASNRAHCLDESPDRSGEVVVRACSALLARTRSGRPERGTLLSHRGRAYLLLRNYSRALPDFREAMRRDSHDPVTANALCWTEAVLGEHLAEARRACDISLRERPNAPDALDSRGLVGLKQGRFQDAWNDYDAAVRIAPNGISWLYGRGVAALRLGRVQDAQGDIERARAMYPAITGMFEFYGIRP
jgi:tetratricopeptide (TPR) repeat protein